MKRWIRRLHFSLRFENLAGLAVGSFGPIDIDPNSKRMVLSRRHLNHWANVDIVGALRRALNVPITLRQMSIALLMVKWWRNNAWTN